MTLEIEMTDQKKTTGYEVETLLLVQEGHFDTVFEMTTVFVTDSLESIRGCLRGEAEMLSDESATEEHSRTIKLKFLYARRENEAEHRETELYRKFKEKLENKVIAGPQTKRLKFMAEK